MDLREHGGRLDAPTLEDPLSCPLQGRRRWIDAGSLQRRVGLDGGVEAQLAELDAEMKRLGAAVEKLENDNRRVRQEAQEKVDKLSERIRELNQQLLRTR